MISFKFPPKSPVGYPCYWRYYPVRKWKGTHGIRIVQRASTRQRILGKYAMKWWLWLPWSFHTWTDVRCLQSLISIANLTHISFGMLYNYQKAKLIRITHYHWQWIHQKAWGTCISFSPLQVGVSCFFFSFLYRDLSHHRRCELHPTVPLHKSHEHHESCPVLFSSECGKWSHVVLKECLNWYLYVFLVAWITLHVHIYILLLYRETMCQSLNRISPYNTNTCTLTTNTTTSHSLCKYTYILISMHMVASAPCKKEL